MDNCWWLKKFHYPGHPPKKGDANAKRSFVWFEANQSSFHSFSLNYLEKKGCNELPGRKKRLLLSLDTFTLRPRNGGMRPLRLWQNSWSHGMCRNPTDPQFFLNMKRFIPQSSQALHVSKYLLKKSVQSNFHEAAFTMMTTIVYDTLDVVSQGPQMLDPMKLNPSTWWHVIFWASSSQVKQLQWTWQYWASEIC